MCWKAPGGRISWTNCGRTDEIVITKYTYDGFVDTHLDAVLKRLGVRTLVLAGVDSDVCVRDTAAHGFAIGYTPVFAQDALAADSEIAHAGVLQSFGEHYGRASSPRRSSRCGRGEPGQRGREYFSAEAFPNG